VNHVGAEGASEVLGRSSCGIRETGVNKNGNPQHKKMRGGNINSFKGSGGDVEKRELSAHGNCKVFDMLSACFRMRGAAPTPREGGRLREQKHICNSSGFEFSKLACARPSGKAGVRERPSGLMSGGAEYAPSQKHQKEQDERGLSTTEVDEMLREAYKRAAHGQSTTI